MSKSEEFNENDLVFVKFILENGGVSRTRSEDDAKSILRYFSSRQQGTSTTEVPTPSKGQPSVDEILENYAYETDGDMDCGHDGNFDKSKANQPY